MNSILILKIHVQFNGKVMWWVPTQHGIRQFIHLVASDSFLCNEIRHRCHLTHSLACVRCFELESGIHLLRDQTSPGLNQSILASMFPTSLTGDVAWSTLFKYHIWHTWKLRNEVIFENNIDDMNVTLVETHISTHIFTKEWEKCKANGLSLTSATSPSPILGPPLHEWIKLNIGGASKNPGPSRVWGIICNNHGMFVRGFSAQLSLCTAFRV